jgi:hypothetical protein
MSAAPEIEAQWKPDVEGVGPSFGRRRDGSLIVWEDGTGEWCGQLRLVREVREQFGENL